jgi:oxygen-independent coproporphyrinogen III oxidase
MSDDTDSLDLARIAAAVGPVPRVGYEAVHVYPMAAPAFTPSPGALRPRPSAGPLRLYIHIPFCNYACTFCSYAKRINGTSVLMRRYVDAVKRELEQVEPGTPLRQLYLGGGTPTALPAELLGEILTAVRARSVPQEGATLTVEGSPESLSEPHIRTLKAHGINRVSMGIQSLDDEVLRMLNRRHDAQRALDVTTQLVDAGFFVNVDLIYGLPQQTQEQFCRDVQAVSARAPQSITLYNLRVNEQTPVRRRIAAAERLDLARLVRWRALVHRVTAELGYVQTRWHTFVRRDAPAWWYDRAPGMNAFGPGRDLGLGVSAHSHLAGTMYRNLDATEAYVECIEAGRSPVEYTFALDERERQTLFVARTLGDGRVLERAQYEDIFGQPIDADFGELLQRLIGADLISDAAGSIALTDTGRLVYDLVTLAFYPPGAQRWLSERAARVAV